MKDLPDFAKQVFVVAVGVFVAGYAMYSLQDLPLVDDARRGFDHGLL